MSRAEVIAILGPPGDYATLPATEPWQDEMHSNLPEDEIAIWQTDVGTIGVSFDSTGKSCGTGWVSILREDRGPIGNLLWRAKRQWHRWFP
jgi:hypothetical protein